MRKLKYFSHNFPGQEVGARMRHSIILAALGLTLAALTAVPVGAEEGEKSLELADNPPDRYVVVKGDTLWGISKRYLKSPWRWPDLWGMNKDEVQNPHLIFPGNVLILDLSGATPRLRMDGDQGPGGLASAARGTGVGSTVKLTPKVRSEQSSSSPILSIPASTIGPFLNRPLIVDTSQFGAAPRIVAGQDQRVTIGAGDVAFVTGFPPDSPLMWQIYRPSKQLVDPVTKEVLGNEVSYIGDARVREFGEVSTVRVLRSREEVLTGDRMVQAPPSDVLAYVPRPAPAGVEGVIISAPEAVSEISPLQVVVLNRGVREGVEVGSVFALYRAGKTVVPRDLPTLSSNDAARAKVELVYSQQKAEQMKPLKLPDERYGLVFVFRVFEKVSYALIMNASRPVNLLDVVRAP
jgi:hypothetical protein